MRPLTLFLCSTLLLAPPALSRTWHVPSEAPTIQAGVDSASSGDVVVIACGVYDEGGIFLKSGLTLTSASGDPDCVTFGLLDAAGHALEGLEVENVVIQGLTIAGHGSLYEEGGGIHGWRSSLQITDCVFRDNFAHNGGGIRLGDCSNTHISHCLFVGNHARGMSGAIEAFGSSGTVSSCTFSGNSSEGIAGALLCDRSSLAVSDCTFTGNTADDLGAAVYVRGLPIPTIENCLIAFNLGSDAVHCFDGMSVPQMTCCDVFGNPLGDWEGLLACQLGINGNIAEDPQFCGVSPDDWENWILQSDSPCAPSPDGCGLKGAWAVGCQTTSGAEMTWGGVKALYR